MSSPENGTEFPRNRQPTMRTVAMPADTNPYGQIFGGWIMAQMDLAGSVLAIEYAQGRVATVAVHSMEFHQPVTVGDLVSSFARIERIGTTSSAGPSASANPSSIRALSFLPVRAVFRFIQPRCRAPETEPVCSGSPPC